MKVTKHKQNFYEGLAMTPISIESESNVLLQSIMVSTADVTADPWEIQKDSEENDYFDVTFE